MSADTITPEAVSERQAYIDGLRELAAFLEQRPDVPVPDQRELSYQALQWADNDARAEMAAIARAIGTAAKRLEGNYFELRREFSGGITYVAWTVRQNVCERVQVGTKTVEVPDPVRRFVRVEEPVYEWRCDPSILRAGA